MPLINYTGWRPVKDAERRLDMVAKVNDVCRDFSARGYSITLRQLHYQFVSRGWHPNTDRAYKNLGQLVSDARRGGLIDWNHVEDRTRFLRAQTHWDSPAQIIRAAARGYHVDLWEGQPTRVEVWVEKDALIDVVARAADRWDVGHISCRGYMSDSEMWSASQRLDGYLHDDAERIVLLHLGDHDPSGLDMTQDIENRLNLFMRRGYALEVRRIALNMDQIEQYGPPPNPAKLTDSRGTNYVERYGDSSWELDALDPDVLVALIEAEVSGEVDMDMYEARRAERDRQRAQLRQVEDRWAEVVEFLDLQL